MSVDHPIILAALDIGSNSFHLLISEVRDGRPLEIKRHKDLVQLARAVNDDGRLDKEAIDRALASLRRCRHLLDQYPVTHLRIVGTQILRQCSDPEQFLDAAQAIMQAPIEIISGDEEASLVYLGVSNSLNKQQRSGRLLVLDIGGASTELITANNDTLEEKHSLELGCVTLANQYFCSRTHISQSSLESAYHHAKRLFLPMRSRMGNKTIELAIGASGTLRVLLDLLHRHSSTKQESIIHQYQLETLLENIKNTGSMGDFVPENLRWDVLPAGIAILTAFLQVFELDAIDVSNSSIKEGMMLEWLNHHTPLGD